MTHSPRCHCDHALPDPDADGVRTCPRCFRLYDSASTLPACKHARTERVGGDADLMRVRCRDCRRAEWAEIPIDEVAS